MVLPAPSTRRRCQFSSLRAIHLKPTSVSTQRTPWRAQRAATSGVVTSDLTTAAFGEPPGDEALPREPLGAAAFEAVEGEGFVGLFGQVEDVGQFHLHAEGGFERLDAGVEERVVGAGGEVAPVHVGHGGEFEFLEPAGGGAAAQVGDRFGARHDECPLVGAGQEIAGPDLTAGVG